MNRILSCCLSRTLLSLLILSGVVPLATAQPNVTGQWSTLTPAMPINPVHVALLKNGKVLIVAGSGNCPPAQTGCPAGAPYGPSNGSGAAVWDPIAGTFAQFTLNWDMFCNAMINLPDGRVLITGGTLQYDPFHGSQRASIFDPANNSFTDVQNMAHGRWYPTTIVLGDGRAMTFSGLDEIGNGNQSIEFYTVGADWTQPSNAPWAPPLYPRMTLLPSGKVFYSGWTTSSALYDPSIDSWTLNVANTVYGNQRTYGTSVLLPLTPANNYDPKVMIFGGGNPATATTEIIDMGAASPHWVTGPAMSQPRIEMNATILPNGKVLAMGGSKNDEDTSTLSLSLNADLFDLSNVDLSATPPKVGTVSSGGANATQRLYHSVSLLLPDATVWLAGGNPVRGSYNTTMEIYKPAYLFNSSGGLATRPTITSAPASITYANQFTVQTPDAASISSVVLVRNGASTHAFNMDQRLVGVSFTAGSGTLTVTAPPNSNIAPPGYYMLFLLNNAGVPSVASFVQLGGSSPPPPPPTAISFVQANTGPPNLQASNTSVAVAFNGAQAAGNLNVLAVGWGDTTSTITSVTDTKNNVYTLAVGPTTNSAGLRQSIYYAKNIAAGSNTVTVRFNQAAAYPDVRILEYTGADTANPLDAKVGASGSGTTPNSGSVTTAVANELIFGSGTTGASFSAAGSGFVNRMINVYGNIAEDKTGTTAGSYNATATTTSAPWVMQVATFRPSGQAPPPPPSVSTIAPTSGTTAGGTSVTITGTGFQAGASVTLGGTAASNVTVVNSSSITATTPAHTAGGVNVVVTNTDSQSGTLNNGYTYVSANPAPTVTAISPASGPTSGGTSVTITGTGFLSGASVTLGGTAATNVVVVSGTQITATTPAHAAGAVTVTVTNSDTQSGSLNNGFTYVAPPTISSVTPNSGPTGGGTGVTLAGTNFVSGATVTFGGTAATNVVVVSGTQITATTPAHAAGAVTVAVTNPDTQSGSLSSGFTYSSATAPTVSSATPNSGPTAGGTGVTLAGTNFVSGATVTFGGTAATNVVVVSGTQITAATPAHAAGAVTVTVTNSDTQSGSLSNGFTYLAPPTVSSATPNNGPTAGGTGVTLAGTNFVSGATVTFGGTAASNVVVVSGTQITATTPAHAAGAVTVTVTNPDTQSGSLSSGFTYSTSTAPTVSSVTPNNGPVAGGTAVTLAGTNFLSGATVTFGGTAATNVVVVNGTQITATTPAHAKGAVNVVVTNTDGQSGTLPSGYTYTSPITFVQANSGPPTLQASNTTVAVAYTGVQTAGNLNVVAVGWGDKTSTINSVTDNRGNVYSLAIGPTTHSSGLRQSIYYAKNISAGSNTVTVTFNQAAAYPDVRILEYAGADTSNPLDAKLGTVGSGTTANSGSVTTTSANELIFGSGTSGSMFTAAGTGFVSRMINAFGNIAEDKTGATAGSYNATATTRSAPWVMQVVTFK